MSISVSVSGNTVSATVQSGGVSAGVSSLNGLSGSVSIAAGDGVSVTASGSTITLAAAGGTSGVTVGSATPLDLGVAAAGTSGNAAREDHVHRLPTIADITAASAVHTHVVADITDLAYPVASVNGSTGTVVLTHTSVSAAAASHSHAASDITSGTLDIARIPTIGYTALSGVPTTFAPATHTHTISAVDGLQTELDGKAAVAATNVSRVVSLNGLTGTLTITAGSNVTVSTSGSSITIAAAAGEGGGGGSAEASRAIVWLLR